MKKLILILLLFSSCVQDKYEHINVINKTNFDIFCDATYTIVEDSICKCFNEFQGSPKLYPDEFINVFTVSKNKKNIYIARSSSIKYEFDISKNKLLVLTIFHKDSLSKNLTWDELYGKRKWIKQYRLTYEDVNRINKTIIFDGK